MPDGAVTIVSARTRARMKPRILTQTKMRASQPTLYMFTWAAVLLTSVELSLQEDLVKGLSFTSPPNGYSVNDISVGVRVEASFDRSIFPDGRCFCYFSFLLRTTRLNFQAYSLLHREPQDTLLTHPNTRTSQLNFRTEKNIVYHMP